jgi:hypothetical protein
MYTFFGYTPFDVLFNEYHMQNIKTSLLTPHPFPTPLFFFFFFFFFVVFIIFVIVFMQILNKYILMNRPVLIRGLNTDSPSWKAYSANQLKLDHGDLPMHVSDIPYNEKFGSFNSIDESLGKYIDEMVNKEGTANYEHPWYAFKGHPVPHKDTEADSLVPIEAVVIPK